MADSCVDHKHCGTAAPGWMNGGHPSVAERVVSRSVCFRSKSNCCKWLIVISVRNCGGFYVYWLQRPPHCNFRYCGSGIQPTSVPTTAQPTHSPVCPHLILSETSGVITSPNFPLNYPENQTCSWQIIARKGKRVKLVIQSLEIQYCRACSCDYLEIENASFADGTPNKKRECGVFFGNITYYSQQDSLRVLFVSDSSQWARGFTAVYTQVPYNTSNECSNYRFLDEINRAITYSNISSWPCDTNLLAGWYRFSGGAGSQMADFCVSDLFRKYCSTDAPGWLSGGHPSVAEGVVRRKVCFPGAIRGCCGYVSNISVRNCGSFFVYKLLPPPHCYLRYCGNGLPLVRECLNYRVLNESNRAVSYNTSTWHCTDTTLSGWYRFSGEAGYQMADSCVNMSHCGTMFPGWLRGGHPGSAEGVVQRKVCFTNFLGCCGASIYISVRNCGSYYVYKLMPLPSCRPFIRTRYCGNHGALSPTSTTSVSSSTPPLMPTTKPLVPTTNETTIKPTTGTSLWNWDSIAEIIRFL
ncbi:unnamed protein product [Porites lobata]|uniref:CUB domain-containing protein n=1 Tax=Porites lobata TaxID=104759 RepID=A0ABN8PFR5_9CNID|nr:unnamed protein product [Porites lobata]